MFRLALSLSILLSTVFPVGQLLLLQFTNGRELQAKLGTLAASLVVLVAKYFFPAAVLYLIFRIARLERFFDFKGRGSTQLFVANVVAMTYIVVLALSRMVEGGGFWYFIGQFAPIVLFPCVAVIVWGLVLLWGTKGDGAATDKLPERTRGR